MNSKQLRFHGVRPNVCTILLPGANSCKGLVNYLKMCQNQGPLLMYFTKNTAATCSTNSIMHVSIDLRLSIKSTNRFLILAIWLSFGRNKLDLGKKVFCQQINFFMIEI